MGITIREKNSGTTLAEGEEDPSVAKYEGNWYFDPAAVHSDVLKVTERHLHLPHQGHLQLGRVRRARRGLGQGRGVGLPEGQGRPRADPGSLRLLRRQPGLDPRRELKGTRPLKG